MFRRLRLQGDPGMAGRSGSLRDEAIETLSQGYDVTRALFHIAGELATISEQLPDTVEAQKAVLLDKAEALIRLGNDLRTQQGTTASVLVNLASVSSG